MRFKRDEVTTFSKLNVIPSIMPHCGTLVIKVVVVNHEVWRVYVDKGAVVSILYLDCFEKLRVDKSYIRPCSPLWTFAQAEVQPKGVVSLPVTVGVDLKLRKMIINSYIVNSLFS